MRGRSSSLLITEALERRTAREILRTLAYFLSFSQKNQVFSQSEVLTTSSGLTLESLRSG